MALFLKILLGIFIITGLATAVYALLEIWHTKSVVQISTGRTKAVFTGYHQEWVKSVSSTPSAVDPGRYDFQESWSVMSYPEFEYRAEDGRVKHVRDPKIHLIERFKPGEAVEILVFQYWEPRLADDYSLYGRDLAIAVFGMLFILIPLIIWQVVIPSLATPAGERLSAHMQSAAETFLQMRAGPFSVASLLKGIGIFILIILAISFVFAALPFIQQLYPHRNNQLIDAIEAKQFSEVRELITAGKGINGKNKYDQSALLLLIEEGKTELAALLIEAGADVNARSPLYKTPLIAAAQSGNLEIVKMLLAKGVKLDDPEDDFPALFYAFNRKHDEIARLLIEAGSDLQKEYPVEDMKVTVGDLAAALHKTELVELIHRRGGKFSK